MTSVWDAQVQEMNAEHVEQWQQTSAYFNGDTVLVEVVAQPGTGINQVILESVTVGLGGLPEAVCNGPDGRVPSSDPRVARLLPQCTAFLHETCVGCFLTSNGCAQPQSVVQFNVPSSTPSGILVHPPVEDQYAVDPASIQGTNIPVEYGSFGTFPNPNTGLTVRQAQGAGFTLDPNLPSLNPQVGVTGYGVDSTPLTSNQVQQTHVASGFAIFCGFVHTASTEIGSGGSPVVDLATGLVIGVHNRCLAQPSPQGASSLLCGCSGCGPLTLLEQPLGVCKVGIFEVLGMPTTLQPNIATPLTVRLQGPMVFGTALFHYRLQPGPFTAQPLTNIGGGQWHGILPPVTCVDAPEWYFSLVNPDCGTLTLPENAPSAVFSAQVADSIATYCTAKPGLACGTPSISGIGAPSASATQGFYVLAGPAQQHRAGVLLYTNGGRNNQPFQGGTLCVSTTGLRRGPPSDSGGFAACDGEFSIDMNAFAAGLAGGHPAAFLSVPGTVVNAQWWGRDSIATGSFLSDAIEYLICD
jgi:hypothetical protein